MNYFGSSNHVTCFYCFVRDFLKLFEHLIVDHACVVVHVEDLAFVIRSCNLVHEVLASNDVALALKTERKTKIKNGR